MNKSQTETLKKILLEVEYRELLKLEKLSVSAGEHSLEFNQKMNSLIEKTKKRESSFLFMNRKRISLAITIAILVVSLLVACTFAPTIKNFFVENFGSYTSLKTGTSRNEIDNVYELTYIPKEYELLDINQYDSYIGYIFVKEKETISLVQGAANVIRVSIDTTEEDYVVCCIGNYNVYKVVRNDYYSFVWLNDDYCFTLTCPTSIPWDEVERIILGIAPVEE